MLGLLAVDLVFDKDGPEVCGCGVPYAQFATTEVGLTKKIIYPTTQIDILLAAAISHVAYLMFSLFPLSTRGFSFRGDGVLSLAISFSDIGLRLPFSVRSG